MADLSLLRLSLSPLETQVLSSLFLKLADVEEVSMEEQPAPKRKPTGSPRRTHPRLPLTTGASAGEPRSSAHQLLDKFLRGPLELLELEKLAALDEGEPDRLVHQEGSSRDLQFLLGMCIM